jgi:hypothetical protein
MDLLLMMLLLLVGWLACMRACLLACLLACKVKLHSIRFNPSRPGSAHAGFARSLVSCVACSARSASKWARGGEGVDRWLWMAQLSVVGALGCVGWKGI